MSDQDELDSERTQTLTEHLSELRVCLVRMAYTFFGGFAACYGFSEKIFAVLRKPILPYLPPGSTGLHFTGVIEKFMAHIKVSFLAGVILTSPIWLYQIWRFIAPGLYSREKKYAFGFITSGIAFFTGGAAFAYYVVFPAAFKFLLGFGGDADQALITISEYFDFIFKCFLGFGAAFETPVILTALGIMGVIDAPMLRKNRRWAVVIMAVVSAIVTPPDAVSMLALLIPLMLLYELSVILVSIFGKKLPSVE